MRKINKLIAILVLISTLSTLFAGCSADELTVLNALMKSSTINSMESKTSLSLRFEASDFLKSDNESLQALPAVLNNMKINIDQKTNQSADKSISKSQIEGSFEIGGISSSLGFWLDSDIVGEKPSIKGIIRMPAIATIAFPAQFRGKPYMVMDMANMPEMGENYSADYKQIIDFSKEFTPKLMEFMKEYAVQFDPGFAFIKNKGGSTVNGEYLNLYGITLDDAAFKALLKYGVKNFMQNEKALDFCEELLKSVVKLSPQGSGLDDEAGADIEQTLKMLKLSAPENVKMVDKVFEAFKDVKLVGDKGIIINFGINNEGYIVSESGSMDFVFDMKAIEAAAQKLTDSDIPIDSLETAGMINVGLDFDIRISNINRDVKIAFPELNEKNSFNYIDMYDVINPVVTDNYGFVPYDYNNEPIGIEVYGKQMGSSVEARVKDYILTVPVRAVGEALGAKVVSNVKNKTVTVQKGSTKIVFKPDSTEALLNGSKINLSVPMTSIDKKNYVPANLLAESFGAKLQWNRKTNTLIITADDGYNVDSQYEE